MKEPRRLRARHREPRKDFARFAAALERPIGRLGLTHVTSGYLVREIIDAGAIVAIEDCPVLREPLVYAFYGRSAFRKRGDEQPSNLHFQFPVVLVLDPAKAPKPKYLFGFDSGAFVHGFMDGFLDDHMPLFDFHVEPDIETAAALAHFFFGDGTRFLKNKPASNISVSDGTYEAVSYLNMVRASSGVSNQLDDRVSTPELIFEEPIPIVEVVKAAIMPDVLAEDAEIGGRLTEMGVRVLPYEWQSGVRPSEYHMTIRGMVEGLYREFDWKH